MKILLIAFLIVCAFYVSNAALTTSIGKSVFFAKVILTNQNYGSGAIFPADVWYNLGLKKMRIDYYQTNGSLIMQVYYDYATKDQYQICGPVCARATWTAAQPLFSGVDWSGLSCFASDYTALGGGPNSCVSGCSAYISQPVQTNGVLNIMFNDTGSSPSQMCLVRFSPSGSIYGPEWHIQSFLSGPSYPSGQDPTVSSIYTPTSTANCPAPSCTSKLDIALVIDESSSIVNAGASTTVLNFCTELVKNLTISDDAIRLGVVFFSGDMGCDTNKTLTGTVNCGSIPCSSCGAKWRHTTGISVYNKKSSILSAIKTINGGMTCISCGIEQGTIILNQQPRPGIQKTIILFTDGKENVLTDRIASQAQYAKANGIDIIAIGTYNFNITQLQQMTTDDKIFTTNDFSQLNTLIAQILTSVCQPLPNIETCDFCSGLCTCMADCSCPTCNNFYQCLNPRCDPKPVSQGGTLGVCVYTARSCDDFDPCTQNLCNNATGCDYSQPTPKPYPRNNLCFDWTCSKALYNGYKYVEVTNACSASSDLCIVRYCNYTQGTTNVGGVNLQGSCVSLNISTIPFGTNASFVNPQNQTVTVAGCQRQNGEPPCVRYTCQANGGCTRDESTCVCKVDSDCYDSGSNAGCTFDTCDTVNNRCVRTVRDCWNELSGGLCPSNMAGVPQSTTTGFEYYNNARTFPTTTNGSNLPTDTPSTRSCDLLACYGGRRSTYQCVSTGTNNGQSYCQRSANACPSNGCGDGICRTLSTWSPTGTGAFNLNSDCGGSATYTCTNANRCNNPACNGGFSGTGCQASGACLTSNGANRCPLISNATLCNQPSICNIYGCDISTGCSITAKPLPVRNFCETWACDASRGNVSTNVGGVSVCTQNPGDLCLIDYCDRNQGTTVVGPDTLQGSCQQINRRSFTVTTTRTWIESNGVTKSITGCANATASCFVYGCNAATGQCTIDQSGCACVDDAGCDDGDGCTDQKCIIGGTNFCQYTRKDCWNFFSQGTCNETTGPNAADTTVGLTVYDSGIIPTWTGNPSAAFTCAALACFGGQRSQYQCVSQSSSVGLCTRVTSECPKGGCLDTICRNLGTWSTGVSPQANTDCGTTRSYTCSDYKCGTRTCNTNYVYPGNNPPSSITDLTTDGVRCIQIDNSTQCQNGDLCKLQGRCDIATGCDFSQNTNAPANPSSNCFDQSCVPSQGWILTPKTCTAPTDLCQITYCNTTDNACVTLNANNIDYQTSVSYVDNFGQTKTFLGCRKPASDDLACREYRCNSTTGQCYQDVTSCKCFNDAGCADGNGCTVDTCNKALNKCERTYIDCIARLSNGACNSRTQTTYTADTTLGEGLYYGNATTPNNYTTVDAKNLPFPETGVTRTCQQLGCYNGAPSKYRCFSTNENTFTCERSFEQCNRNGCQDNICRTLGTWTNDTSGDFQIDADCGTTYIPNCADTNSCTNDFCNSDWVPTQDVSLRCIHQLVNELVFCDDGNFCTKDRCDEGDTSGQVCTHTLYDEQTLRSSICPNDGQDHNCTTVECTVNRCIYRPLICPDSTLCILNLCNASTLNTCVAVYSGIFVVDGCGVCDGDGTSCSPNSPAEPRATSIAVALGIGLGIGLCVAAIIIAILTRTGYAAYAALAMEVTGSATINNTYVDNVDNFDAN